MQENRPVLTIPDAAKKALEGGLEDVRVESLPDPEVVKRARLHLSRACSLVIRYSIFGERLEPTLRQRLSINTSHFGLIGYYW